MHIMKKRNKNILSAFTVEVSLNADKATLNNNENMQMKKSTKNNNIVKSMKNNNTVLSTKNSNTVKSINYDNLMNITFKSFTHTTIDQLDSIESVNLFEFSALALINSFNFSSFMKNKFKLNNNQLMYELEFMS